MQIPEPILVLIDKYLAGKASAEDIGQLNEWYRQFNDSSTELDTTDQLDELQLGDRIKSRLFATIRSQEAPVPVSRPRRWLIPAAAILILLSVAAYFFFNPGKKGQAIAANNNKTIPAAPILPGGNKAVLILADGSSIILDSTTNGIISQQGAVKVNKLENGLLVYMVNGRQITENDEAFYNTISTPRGGQYQVTLTDGTKVWLNAASSIRFPVVFTGSNRKVEITGEAYFEVEKNAKMPFIVKAGESEVEVLGTHFNVNAYNDEAAIRTSLLEGSVKVSVGKGPREYLQPGQQSGITKDGKIRIYDHVDMEEVMAWKDGRFQFKSADLSTILRQISRWYDVDIEYRNNVNLHFTGQLPRSSQAASFFEKLEMTGEVHFKVEGRKIIVLR
ncbi:MAG: FecR domain-containing protein [Chitinophagaceae bacterium]|nr:FecR domain-containing protein [Chitinophagaceae bacterium]